MTRIFLLLAILGNQIHLPTLLPSVSQGFNSSLIPGNSDQDDRPLNIQQVEELLKFIDDEDLALLIRRRGIGFRLTATTLERLLEQRLGVKTKQALEEKEELAAYKELSEENNPARKLNLGNEFLQKYPRSSNSAKVKGELRNTELDVFEAEFRTFSSKPDAAGLNKVLALGRNLLQQQPDAPTNIHVNSKLALATSKGMIGNFYNDLERSREYADQALKLLEPTTPPAGVDAQTYGQLRANNLGAVYQSRAIYLIRQSVPDSQQTAIMNQAISLLSKAAELKEGPSASDPITYWLRAQAREWIFQKLGDEYRALSKTQRVGRAGQTLCAQMATLTGQLSLDYIQVVAFASRTDSAQSSQLTQLKDEAIAANQLLVTGERPCASGRNGPIDELPSEDSRYAVVIGVEDHVDKQAGKLNFAASDAQEFAKVLIQHGGFRKDHVVVMATGEPAERQPTSGLILQQLAELPKRVPPDGLLLIYFVGLGLEQNGKSYLLAADSLPSSESLLARTAINLDELKDMIRASGASQVMLFFDAFRRAPVSENFVRQLTFDVSKNDVTAFATLLSAQAGQRAYESSAKKHGVFTSVLLEAANGKAASKERTVTLADLIKYLENNVPREAASGGEQLPWAKVDGYEKEDLILFQPTSSAAQAQPNKPTPSELIRNSKTIQVHGKTVWLDEKVLEAELQKLPEFQNLSLTFVEKGKEADLVIEVKLPFLTWNWNYTVTHRPSNTILFSGKKKGATDNSVSPELAKLLVTRLLELRDPPQTPLKK